MEKFKLKNRWAINCCKLGPWKFRNEVKLCSGIAFGNRVKLWTGIAFGNGSEVVDWDRKFMKNKISHMAVSGP